MSAIKQLLWQVDDLKPKRNFIKENARRFKDPKKSYQDELDSRSKNISTLSSNRMAKSSSRQQNVSSNKVRVTAAPHGTTSHRRPLRAFPIKKSIPGIQPEVKNEAKLSFLHERDRPITYLPAKQKEPPKGFRNQACQTLQGKELDYLTHEGVIRYPSSRYNRSEEYKSPHQICVREMGLQTEDYIPRNTGKAAGDIMEHNRLVGNKGVVDFVKLNMLTPLKPKQTNTGKEDPIRAPTAYQKGVLPKYLREHKKDKENEKDGSGDVLENNITAQMLLPDDMRKKLLMKLKKDHKELVDQLNLLPFSTSSLKILQRKQQLEKELDILEKRISNFSREKVFIRDVSFV